MKIFPEFCNSTSLHGWALLISSPSTTRKIYWIIVIFFSFICGCFFVFTTLDEFFKTYSTTSVATTTAPVKKSTFPKLTICNVYRIRNSFLDSIFDPEKRLDKDVIELKNAFVKYFISGYSVKEEESLKDILKELNETYINSKQFNETLKRECPNYSDIPNNTFNCEFIKYPWQQHPFNEFKKELMLTASQSFFSLVLEHKFQDVFPNSTHYQPVDMMNSFPEFTDRDYCYSIQPNSTTYPILTGQTNGVQILLDAETFDNGENSDNGLSVVIGNKEDKPLVSLNGISVSPGSSVKISLKSSIYDTSPTAISRFNYKERKCVSEADWPTIDGDHYSLSYCLKHAAEENILDQCGTDVDWSGIYNYGLVQYCYQFYNGRVGERLTTVKFNADSNTSETFQCQVSCSRQENEAAVTSHSFPSLRFMFEKEFWLVVKKLYRSCHNTKTKHGYKRLGLDRIYPDLCPMFDKYIYTNQKIDQGFAKENLMEFVKWQEEFFRLDQLEENGINDVESKKFLEVIMQYSKDNLVFIKAYISSPFVTEYYTDQAMSYITLIANMGGLLGLCMGFSLVSLTEIFYHAVFNPLLTIAKQGNDGKKRAK